MGGAYMRKGTNWNEDPKPIITVHTARWYDMESFPRDIICNN